MSCFDVIVVGAGIVGCPMAVTMAKQGRKVLLLERDMKEPDRIVGELLQPGGCLALEKMGMSACLDGIDAVDTFGYAVIKNPKEQVLLKYPLREGKESVKNIESSHETDGDETSSQTSEPSQSSGETIGEEGKRWFGRSFHHGRFIMNLRKAAQQEKLVTVVEATATGLIEDKNGAVIGVTANVKGEPEETSSQSFYAPLTVVADGCFSKFRKDLSKAQPLVTGNFVGLVLKDCPLPYPNHGHVVLADPSPILLYQIGTHETRILVDIPGTKLPSAGNGDLAKYLESKVTPQLPEATRPSFLTAIKNDRIRSMPNQFLPAVRSSKKGVMLLGDASNMRHPLTGGGMTVGFNDVYVVSESLKHLKNFEDYAAVDKALKQAWVDRKGLSCVVNTLSIALYDLFAAGTDENFQLLREACFGYFLLGGRAVSDPVSLLGGILPSPLLLFLHFFAVAFYAIGMIMMRDYNVPKNLYRSIVVLWTAARTIFPYLWAEL